MANKYKPMKTNATYSSFTDFYDELYVRQFTPINNQKLKTMTTLENEKPTPEETYTKADLVSFGNYLLSQERENMVSEINKREVTHADLENWRETIVNG